MSEKQTRCTLSVSPPVIDQLHKIRDKLAAHTGVQTSMTQVIEYLVAVESQKIKALN